MFSSLVIDLIERFSNLEEKSKAFAAAVRADSNLPLLLPTYSGKPGQVRETAITAMTMLYRQNVTDPPLPTAGLVCSSPETVAAAEDLNSAKAEFHEAVKALRRISKSESSRIDKLITRMLGEEGQRDENLKTALARARLGELDLLRCYARVRILPSGLLSISWTWATQHTSSVQISLKEAQAMAAKIPDDEVRLTAYDKLNQLSPDEPLVIRKKVPNQLRANIAWSEDGKRRRKTVPISGIALSQDERLPEYIWRDEPADDEGERPTRLKRSDSVIESEPYIKAMRLYRHDSEK